MNVNFYKYAGANNVINKNLGEPTLINCNMEVATTQINPTVQVTFEDNAAPSSLDYNYCIVTLGDVNYPYFIDLNNVVNIGKGVFNVVTVNPPYMAGGSGLVGADYSKAVSRHEILCSLEDVIRESANVLVAGGRMYMVHRPYRLGDIICLMKQYKMSPRRLCMVHPKASQEANLVLIEGIRGGNTQIRVEAPLVLFDEDGQESKQIKMIHGRL